MQFRAVIIQEDITNFGRAAVFKDAWFFLSSKIES